MNKIKYLFSLKKKGKKKKVTFYEKKKKKKKSLFPTLFFYQSIDHFNSLSKSLLYSYLEHYFKQILDDNRHWFVKFRSPNTNLVTCHNYLVNVVDEGYQVDVIYADFSKAFDRVILNT